jgi:hypothetical protein
MAVLAATSVREARRNVVYAAMLARLLWLLHKVSDYAIVGSHRGHQGDNGKRLPERA